jgi:hypothetical protein
MIRQSADKSSHDNGLRTAGRIPGYAFAGLALMVACQAILFTGNRFVGMYYTPLQWTGLILLLDGVVKARRGESLLSDHPREFMLLAVISIGSWCIFEGYNVVLENWRYLGLPENRLVRYGGYAWAFATISPGMFLIYQVIDSFVPGTDDRRSARLPDPVFYAFVVFGAACLVVPLVWPSTWMTPLVWMGFAFFLDPINGRLGERSILTEFFTGRTRSLSLFFAAGLVAGLFWEFWNYWAHSKWEYDVPYLGHIKLFEMPVLGFLGFMPFVVESFAIYTFVRRFLPIPREVRYLG